MIRSFLYTKQYSFLSKIQNLLVRKPERKFYYFMAKFQGSGFSFQSLNQNIKVVVFPSIVWFQKFKVVVFPSNFWIQFFKVVVFPSNFWNITIIWRFFRVILNLAQECYYLENKVGVVDFTKARGLAKFQSPQSLVHHGEPLGFKTLPFLGRLQNLLLPLYFQGNVSLPQFS